MKEKYIQKEVEIVYIVNIELLNTIVLQPLIDTFIHKTLIYPQYLDFFMSSLMHFFVVLYCVSRETMV